MVTSCSICRTRAQSGISMHRIPKVNARWSTEYVTLLKSRRKEWIRVLERTQIVDMDNLGQYLVCSRHFVSGKPADFRNQKDVDWIPTLHCGERNEGGRSATADVTSVDIPTVERSTKTNEANDVTNDLSFLTTTECREETKQSDEAVREFLDVMSTLNHTEEKTGMNEVDDTSFNELQSFLFGEEDNALETETVQRAEDIEMITIPKAEHMEMTALIESLQSQLKIEQKRVEGLQKQVERLSWTESSFSREDNKKVLFYTGLQNLGLFKVIVSYCEIPLDCVTGGKSKLSNFQKLLLTLMKLRHNVSYTELSYRFNIWVAEASSIFKNVVVILFETFTELVHWPPRELLRNRVPECFREAYGDKVAIIIDCFEIKTESPASIRARAQSYSQYKAAITGKYLIGITHHGYIAFVSDGYGGRVSDKYITEDSGILDNLQPGDLVLADRGFTVNEMVCMRYARLNIPAFTERGGAQLCPRAIEQTRKIASVRIHVERIIGLLRNKYTILKGPIPISLLRINHNDKNFLDIIVRVCCMLTNLSEPIIPEKISKTKKAKFLARSKYK